MRLNTLSTGGRSSSIDQKSAANRRKTLLALASAVMACGFSVSAVHAATYIYDPSLNTAGGSDGSGVWDTTTSNWYSGALKPWSNLTADTALFGNSSAGVAGTVTVSTVTAGTIQFNAVSGSYVLTGGQINLGGPSTINLSSTGTLLTPTINSVIAGSTGLLITGNNAQANASASTLTLGGLNTYTGTTNVSGGVTLSVSSLPTGTSTASNLGNSGTLILSGSTGSQNTGANFNAGSELLYTGGSQTTPMNISFGSTAAIQNIINVANPSTVLSISGQTTAVIGATTFRFYKQGPGTLAFTGSGTNSFNNAAFFLVDNGTLQLGAPGQIDNIANGIVVGNQLAAPGGTPLYSQVGGTVNVNGPLQFSNGDPFTGQTLAMNISGGILNVVNVQLMVAGTNVSTLTLGNAAVINDSGNLEGVATATTSIINMSGTSQFNNTGGAISYLVGNGGGTVTFNQSGGTALFNAGLQITGSGTSVETGAYNLGNGTLGSGTLDTLSLSGNSTNASSVASLNFNGGTLQAFGNSTAFVTGVTANVMSVGAVIDTQSFNVTVASPLLASTASPGGGLTKLGTGILTLTGTSTYTGSTNISNGFLQLGNTTTAGVVGSTLPIIGSGGLTYAEPLASAAITPNPTNSYTGPTNISGGSTLSLGNIPNGLSVSAIGASSNASGNLLLVGTAGTQNNFGAGATLLYTGTGNATTDRGITFGGTVQNTINVSSGSAVLTIAGQTQTLSTTGTFRFYKEGAGTLAFTNPGPNSFNSGIYFLVDAGTLQLGSPGQVDNISAGLIVGNQLATPGASPLYSQIDGTVNVSGTLGYSNGDPNIGQNLTANISGGTLNVTGVQLMVNGTNNSFLNLSNAGVINDSGNISAVASNGSTSVLNISGTSQLNVTGGLSTLSGGGGTTATVVTVNQTGGTVMFSSGVGLVSSGSGLATATYNLGSGAAGSGTLNTANVFAYSTNASSSAVLNFNGGTLQAASNNAAFITNLNAANVLAGGAVIDTQGFNVGIPQPLLHGGSAPIDGGLIKMGSGTLTLSSSSTYTGNTQVQAGTLAVANSQALGTTGSVVLSNNTTLSLGLASVQSGFSNFTTSTNGAYTPTFSAGNTAVTLTTNVNSEATSVFSNSPVTVNDLTGFTASFLYTHSNIGTQGAGADGITFTFQNQSNTALGATGGSLGYNAGTGFTTITPSVAAAVDDYHDELATGQNGILNEGAFGTAPGISNTSSSFVTIVYNGVTQTFTETLSDAQGTYTTTLTNFDLASQLGETGPAVTGYIGFTGGTGGINDTQTISNFTFSTPVSSGLTVANPVMVAPGGLSTIVLSPTASFSSGGVGPITIGAGATLAISIGSNAFTGVTHGVLSTPSVTFATPGSGTLDVANNALDITSQSLATVTAMVANAYSNGTWLGQGISSSAAANDSTHLTALGVISNTTTGGSQLYGSGTSLGLFEGISPGAADVLVKYTYYGDANLDGHVDGSDYSLIDNGYANKLTGWYNGDFNYDGVVDGSDYTLIDNAFNSQGASLAGQVASPTAQLAGGNTAVPEPASLTLLTLGTIGTLARRRRR